jgi:hypothetical protein
MPYILIALTILLRLRPHPFGVTPNGERIMSVGDVLLTDG